MRNRAAGLLHALDLTPYPFVSPASHTSTHVIPRRENRHKALFLAFEALDEQKTGVLPKSLVAYVLKRLRPKYSDKKIEVRAFVGVREVEMRCKLLDGLMLTPHHTTISITPTVDADEDHQQAAAGRVQLRAVRAADGLPR